MASDYTSARAAFEALERIAELSDQVELDADRESLMQEPTKKRAAQLYCAGIRLWFQEHGITPDTAHIATEFAIT